MTQAMKIPLLCYFENFLLTAVPGQGALSRRLAALRYWPAQRNRPPRH
jgi:hypothetical protein